MRSQAMCVVLIAQCVGCSQPKSKVSSSAHASTDSGDASLAPPKAIHLSHDRLSVGSCRFIEVNFETSAPASGDDLLISTPADEPFSISTSAVTDKLYSDDSCTKPATSVTILKGESNNLFYFKGAAVGSSSITVKDTGSLKLPEITVPYNVYLIGSLQITGPATQHPADCGKFKLVSVLGDQTTASPVGTDSTVVLESSSPQTGNFYSDDKCSTSITSVKIPAGSATAEFFYSDSAIGVPSIDAVIAQAKPEPRHASVFGDSSDDINGSISIKIGNGSGSAPAAIQLTQTLGDPIVFANVYTNDGSYLIDFSCDTTHGADKLSYSCKDDRFNIQLSGGVAGSSDLNGSLQAGATTYKLTCAAVKPGPSGQNFLKYICPVQPTN